MITTTKLKKSGIVRYEIRKKRSKLTLLHYTSTASLSLESEATELVPFQAIDIYLTAPELRNLAGELTRRANILDALEKTNVR